ncbi:13019_t:CDS:1, partial [Racocetra persica]
NTVYETTANRHTLFEKSLLIDSDLVVVPADYPTILANAGCILTANQTCDIIDTS